MPARRFDYQDVDGTRGFQVAALVPMRRGTEWAGWRTLDELPHGFTPAARGGRTSSRSQSPPRGADAAAPVVFAHPLGITDALRQRFHVGPLTPAGNTRPFHVAFDAADWDRSSGMNAPGQSGSAASQHFSDLARGWARGEDVTLVFSDAAVQAQAESTLTLVPPRPRP
jgi:acyl-homoserine lactone acylase PvdQ